MTKEFVLNYISTNKNIKDYCQRVSRQWADDLFQYLFEVLASKSDSFLIEKYNEKKIEQYCFGIIYKSANYPSSTFYQQNISFTNNNCFDADIDILQYNSEYCEIPLKKEIEGYRSEIKSNWYEVELFNLYLELGTYKKVQEATGINHLSVRYSVVNFINEIKKRCEKYY